jgi:hypothetical protein
MKDWVSDSDKYDQRKTGQHKYKLWPSDQRPRLLTKVQRDKLYGGGVGEKISGMQQ